MGAARTRYEFSEAPKRLTLLTFLLVSELFLATYYFGNTGFAWAEVWFFYVANITLYVTTLRGGTWKTKRLEVDIPIFVMALVFYSFVIYSRIAPEFGGGHSISAIVHFSGTSTVFPTESERLSIIDETSDGYYFVRTTTHNPKAYFVPRQSVSTIEYLTEIHLPNEVDE